jgi:hypothetical protein
MQANFESIVYQQITKQTAHGEDFKALIQSMKGKNSPLLPTQSTLTQSGASSNPKPVQSPIPQLRVYQPIP